MLKEHYGIYGPATSMSIDGPPHGPLVLCQPNVSSAAGVMTPADYPITVDHQLLSELVHAPYHGL
jgi:hypothetical protein